MSREDWAESLLAVVETLAALAVCFVICLVVGAVLLVFLAPPLWTVEYPLNPVRADAAPPADVALRVSDLDLPEGVEVMTAEGGSRLVLTGCPDRDLRRGDISEILVAEGYAPAETFELTRELDLPATVDKISIPYLTLQAIVFIGAGLILTRFRLRPNPARRVASLARSVPLGLAAGVCAFVTSLALAGILSLLGLPVTEQDWVRDLLEDRGQVARLVPWLVLIVPVSEEVFFRGYMFRRIAERAGTAAGMAISSVTFAVMHFNLSGFLVYVGIGCILAWVYSRTGRLAAPIAGHVIHNTIVLLVAVFAPAP
jgi:membrane protease YdiL (CAAX protease family)